MTPIDHLVALSRAVGDPALDAAILGEGNTSIAIDEATFAVKGSGCSLEAFAPEHAVALKRAPILALLDQDLDLDGLNAAYDAAKVDPGQVRRASVETILHALLLDLPGVTAVAHTHPTAVNSLLCTSQWREHLAGRLCPDEAVVLGPDSAFVPYVDPGLVLARAVREAVADYRKRIGAVPKAIYMQNHGFIAVAANPREAENITRMAIKAARMRLGCLQAGGIAALPEATVAHLLGRSDEVYRQAQLAAKA